MRFQTHAPHTRHSIIHIVVGALMLLPMVGCFGDSGLFGDSDSGLIDDDNLSLNLAGTYDVRYELDFDLSTCNEQIAPYNVDATATTQMENDQIRVNFQFPDAPVAIVGYYDDETDEYEGETTPVEISPGQYAQEYWTTDWQISAEVTSFSGFSTVNFGSTLSEDESEVDPDCFRYFAINGLRY